MEYDPRMIEAHNKTLAAYDRLIEILEDPDMSEDGKRAKLLVFYDKRCNYCAADEEIRCRVQSKTCQGCILNTSKVPEAEDCCRNTEEADDTYAASRDAVWTADNEMAGKFIIAEAIKAFRNRRNFLAQRAKENMEKDNE